MRPQKPEPACVRGARSSPWPAADPRKSARPVRQGNSPSWVYICPGRRSIRYAKEKHNVIVLTTSTGQIGRQVLNHLLESNVPLRLIVRNPSRLPSSTYDRAEVIQGSHGDQHVVDHAFIGADAVFWLVPPDPKAASVEAAYVGFSQPACEAIVRHRVPRVVGISALGRGTPWAEHAGLVTASLKMDDLISSTGTAYRALAMPSFMDNLLRQVQVIKNEGMFTLPIVGDLKQPSCATRDIATIAARLLLDDSWTGHAEVPVMGAEDVSYNDMAEVMSEVLGRPIVFRQLALDAFKARLLSLGMSEPMAQAVTDMWDAYGKGLDTLQKRTPESTTPTTFRQWCEEVLKPVVLA
jgi:uncharacterized protein YbjT (DUF2867 family)